MKQLTLRRIAGAIGADYSGPDAPVHHISTDSRDIPRGCLFIALKGDTFDGHRFAGAALEAGAAAVVAMEDLDLPQKKVLRVGDTGQALLDAARYYRQQLDIKVVGVTGSVGKTTTKEMVACVLSSVFTTLKTEANLNNEVGLPKTILDLDNRHRAAVLEMGMDGPGQIARMARCALPDVGVITNIGVSHMERLGSRENILAAKLELREGMADGSTLILCGDNDLLGGVRDNRLRVLFYGIKNPGCGLLARDIRELPTHTEFVIYYLGKRFAADIPCIGAHNVYNALAAFGVGVTLGVDPDAAVAALHWYRPAGMRQKMVERGGVTFVEDCYNASPDSMEAALRTLGGMAVRGRRIAVLSDMLELGAIAQDEHARMGALAATAGVELLLCTGGLSRHTIRGAGEAGLEGLYFEEKADLSQYLLNALRPGDVVWCKASRGMRLEEVLQVVYTGRTLL